MLALIQARHGNPTQYPLRPLLKPDGDGQVESAVAAGIVPGAKAAAAKQQAKGQTLKERLAACRASERERLAFGKVSFTLIGLNSGLVQCRLCFPWPTSNLKTAWLENALLVCRGYT